MIPIYDTLSDEDRESIRIATIFNKASERITELESQNAELKEAVINLMNIHHFSKKEASIVYTETRKLLNRLCLKQ